MDDRMPPGVQSLEHTADIGMDVTAASLPELFERAALGLIAFTTGGDAEPFAAPAVTETVSLQASDTAALLAAWLRELLFLMETRRLCFHAVEFDRLDNRGLVARVQLRECGAFIREIKGVTYHDLRVSQQNGRWTARVIFDV